MRQSAAVLVYEASMSILLDMSAAFYFKSSLTLSSVFIIESLLWC
jgi:hypothetical protein